MLAFADVPQFVGFGVVHEVEFACLVVGEHADFFVVRVEFDLSFFVLEVDYVLEEFGCGFEFLLLFVETADDVCVDGVVV